MRIGVVTDGAWLDRHYDDVMKPEALVDMWGFKKATLSEEFSDVHGVAAAEGNQVVGILPLVHWGGKVEILGQFLAEAYRLNIPDEIWPELMAKVDGPMYVRYSARRHPGMVADDQHEAYLALPATDQVRWYENLFTGSNSRRLLRQALEYKETVRYEVAVDYTCADIDTMIRYSVERLGEESRFLNSGAIHSLEGVLRFLAERHSVRVIRYWIGNNLVGVTFISLDFKTLQLTYLSGFYANRLKNFGKFMYYSFVEIGEKWHMREINALAPVYRIKSDMLYGSRELYGLERTSCS